MKAIESVKTFLADRYRKLYPDFQDFAAGFSPCHPGWVWVSDDLLPFDDHHRNAMMLDPDVGVVLFFFRFSSNTNVRAQVSRAIGYRSRLLPQRVGRDDSDESGSWRVMAHWLVDGAQVLDWQEQVSVLRRDTAHMEELPVDAIVRNDSRSWDACVRDHDLPRLLLRTRAVLAMASTDKVFEWSSADTRVRGAMAGFADQFSDETERRLARQVEARMNKGKPAAGSEVAAALAGPTRMESLSVHCLRNLFEVDLSFAGDSAQAAVVHGPNGTGKSNLFEAVEFALRGTSQRAEKFLKDSDVTTTRKEREYLEAYLTPFGTDARTIIKLNGEDTSPSTERLKGGMLSGNLLSQENVERLIDKPASELAAEILGEFSGLADDLREYADGELAQAQGNLKNMLGRLGLERPGAVTRQETARAKVAELQLRDIVSTPSHLLASLQNEAWTWTPLTAHVGSVVSALLARQHSLGDFVTGIGKPVSSEDLRVRLRDFLAPFWQAQRAADQFLEFVAHLHSEWPADLVGKLDLWGRWLTERQTMPAMTESQGALKKSAQRKVHADELALLTRRGALCRERARHFETLQQFLDGPWKDMGEQHCPTCNTDFSEHGGIFAAVKAVREANDENLKALRERYAATQAKMTALDKELQLLDKTRCPLSDGEQAMVRQALAACLPEDVSLDSLLTSPDERTRCLAWINAVERLPTAPQFARNADEDKHVVSIAEAILAAYTNMEMGFLLPDAWKKVATKLKDRLATVLDQHLPDTLGGLWRELVLNLTPAPWQIRGPLGMQVESRRGKQAIRLTIDIDGKPRLARYVLNEAEKLSLGLAWFLVRYISHGRFQHAVLTLDDPALDMDQTTFRDLCRLLESLLRLHRRTGKPLAMLILLHQDERALDAARATGGLLYRLEWNAGQARFAKSVKLHSDPYRHPLPSNALGLGTLEKASTA